MLVRNDIVGKRIKAVFLTRVEECGTGYTTRDGLIQLEDQITFPLACTGCPARYIESIACGAAMPKGLEVAKYLNCFGEVIEEVLFSDQWSPFSLGLMLSSDRVLCQGDSPWSSMPIIVDAEYYLRHKPVVIWDGRPFQETRDQTGREENE